MSAVEGRSSHTRTAVTTTVTITSCAAMSTCASANPAATSAPPAAPIENAAWKCGRIARSIRCSTTAALMLIGTLMSAPHSPLMNRPTTNTPTLPVPVATARSPKPITLPAVPAANVMRLPKRATMAPVASPPVNDPMPPTMSSEPSWSEVMSRESRIDGIRLVHAAMMRPKSRNCTMSDQRARETDVSGGTRRHYRARMPRGTSSRQAQRRNGNAATPHHSNAARQGAENSHPVIQSGSSPCS